MTWRLKEIEKEKELSRVYMMLAAYPLLMIFAVILSQYTGPVIPVTLYVIYLAYIVFRFSKIANADLQ